VQGDWDFQDLRRSGGEWTSGTDNCGRMGSRVS
jgi:hypothetical protein